MKVTADKSDILLPDEMKRSSIGEWVTGMVLPAYDKTDILNYCCKADGNYNY